MNRPYIVCHMVPSVDGRILTQRWKIGQTFHTEYERTAATFEADGWIIGRISMEPFAGKAQLPKGKVAKLPRTDWVAPHDAESYAIAIDPSGKLRWKSGSIDGEHVVTILTERVSDAYLSFLRAKGISYFFGGRSEIDLKRVLKNLHRALGIEKLLLEGGGGINGTFLQDDLVDELSVLLVPVADGARGIPTLFDVPGRSPARTLKLKSVEKRAASIVWLRYTRDR